MTGKHASPLVRFLRDPSRELARALSLVEHHAAHFLPLAIALCACAAALVCLVLCSGAAPACSRAAHRGLAIRCSCSS